MEKSFLKATGTEKGKKEEYLEIPLLKLVITSVPIKKVSSFDVFAACIFEILPLHPFLVYNSV